MTLRAIAGLFAFNLFVLAVGWSVLFGIRGWRSWAELLRLSGVAYLIGVSSFFVVLTLELVLGVPYGLATVVLTGVTLAFAGVLVGRARGFVASDLVWRAPILRPSLFAAVFVGAIGVYFESLFRAGRLADLGWDVWSSWVPRAKAIYFFGGLDPELFASLPGASYPPGVPALNAVAFHAMGSADAVTLHLQYWFLGIGFAAAVAGLLWNRVHAGILLPLVLLMLLMPDLRNRATDLYGDVPLGYLVAVSALLVLLWIRDSSPWQLAAAALLLGGAMLTKREGMLFALCVVVAALAATFSDRRRAWPRVAAAGAVALALALPWRVWFTLKDLPTDAPEAGYFGVLDDFDSAWPSFELVVRTFFDYDLWLLVPTLGIAAAVLAFLAGARKEAVFVVVFLATSLVGCAWTFWSNPSLEVGNEQGLVNRVVGTPALALAALTPILLELAWRAGAPLLETRPSGNSSQMARTVATATIVGVGLVVYPAITLAGGGARFPKTTDCVVAPIEGQKVRVVFGYRDTFPDAIVLRDRALGVGFRGTEAAQDGCGRVRVFLDDVPSENTGAEIAREANTVDLQPTLEHDLDG